MKRDHALEQHIRALLKLRREKPLEYRLVMQMFREICPGARASGASPMEVR